MIQIFNSTGCSKSGSGRMSFVSYPDHSQISMKSSLDLTNAIAVAHAKFMWCNGSRDPESESEFSFLCLLDELPYLNYYKFFFLTISFIVQKRFCAVCTHCRHSDHIHYTTQNNLHNRNAKEPMDLVKNETFQNYSLNNYY